VAWFAQRGYTVFVPSGAARLSITAVDDAAARMGSLPVKDWVIIGHSMGGFSSLELISRHLPLVGALALWACAMPADYSSLKLPPAVEYVTVANHRGVALYSHQFFDDEATLSPGEQIVFANERTAAFFAAQL
jgi:pimeloyl-ACP methyl ester carboxylesterase